MTLGDFRLLLSTSLQVVVHLVGMPIMGSYASLEVYAIPLVMDVRISRIIANARPASSDGAAPDMRACSSGSLPLSVEALGLSLVHCRGLQGREWANRMSASPRRVHVPLAVRLAFRACGLPRVPCPRAACTVLMLQLAQHARCNPWKSVPLWPLGAHMPVHQLFYVLWSE
jgi:hypothetical protein